MNRKKFIYNIVFGFGGQLIILALGIVVPRLILKSYGDDANGFTNAIGQIFTYLALIEAGVGQSALQALYKPIVSDDREKTSKILCATKNSFKRLTYIYILAVFVFALIYPLFVLKDDLSVIAVMGSEYLGAVLIILLNGFANAISFYCISALKQLFIADGRNYIIVNITTFIRVLGSVVKIFLVNIGVNLVIVQLAALGVTILDVSIYLYVYNKKYPWIEKKCIPDYESQKERNSFLVHELANAIFCSTDMIVLSVFCNLKVVSIYAIYNMIFTAINGLINSIHSGCYYVLGQTYNQEKERYSKVHDCYDVYYMAFVFSMMTVTYILIIPFIKLYTAGATDLNYVDNILPVMFCLINLLSSCRITNSNLIKISGHAKPTIIRAVAEAVINLGVSLIAVQFMGIYGVLLGTIVALLYRTNDMILYGNIRIMKRSPLKTYRTVFVYFAVFGISVTLSRFFKLDLNSYIEIGVCGIVCSIIVSGIYIIIGSAVNLESFRLLCRHIFIKKFSLRRN